MNILIAIFLLVLAVGALTLIYKTRKKADDLSATGDHDIQVLSLTATWVFCCVYLISFGILLFMGLVCWIRFLVTNFPMVLGISVAIFILATTIHSLIIIFKDKFSKKGVKKYEN